MVNTKRKAFILAHPNVPARALVILAAKKGLKLSTRWIYDVRGPQKTVAKAATPPVKAAKKLPVKVAPRPAPKPQQTQEQKLIELSFLLGLTRANTLLELLRENARRVVLA